MVHLSDPVTGAALREAIRKDVGIRLDSIADRLEEEIEDARHPEEMEQILTEALSEATRVFARGIQARVRESRRSRD
ncbi:MAG: hypothetical protein P8172_14550 [Gammaproteobacteria bacterium]